MMSKLCVRLAVTGLLAGCVSDEGMKYSMQNFEGIPDYITNDGRYSPEIARRSFLANIRIAESLPVVSRMSCGPFSITLTASGVADGNDYHVMYEGGSGTYSGFALLIEAPPGFAERVRFRDLVYPDGNAKIRHMGPNGQWQDITNQGRTYTPESGPQMHHDRYFGFDPSRNEFAFVGGKIAMITAWDRFTGRTTAYPDSGPTGRYRVSFTTDYEMEWKGGSCQFRLPDMEFNFVGNRHISD